MSLMPLKLTEVISWLGLVGVLLSAVVFAGNRAYENSQPPTAARIQSLEKAILDATPASARACTQDRFKAIENMRMETFGKTKAAMENAIDACADITRPKA